MTHAHTLRDAVAAVGDADGAMRFVTWFTTRWTRPPARGDEFGPEEIAAAEQRLGLRLPGALARLYERVGRHEPTNRQDRLLSPDRLVTDDGVLVFRVENQHW
ncbi:SMI1/KNR4 family protein [Streptomyces peucetius]|uniref:SMI1/KNR4 family protein n=1 Tax=Streptomyces peucetius TaxID=1950 RepID=A0ABY6I5C5_STRPE|nr:SMI1/KNR4 family protein [Streptomyces peucetius]UYQ61944.1 SMI1/KNR4 family protein [Streptomyces peucetius]